MSQRSNLDAVAALNRLGVPHPEQELPPFPDDMAPDRIAFDVPELRRNYVTARPETLEDMRLLVGVPVELAHRCEAEMESREVDFSLLPTEPFQAGSLDSRQVRELEKHAWNLLLGRLDDIDLEAEPHASTVRYILGRARSLPVLVAKDLVVHDGEVKKLSGPTAVFNKVTVYGSGEIQLQDDVKIMAQKIERLPAP